MTQTETRTVPNLLRRFFDAFTDFFGGSRSLGFGGGEKLAPKHPFPSGIPSAKGDSSGKAVEKK